MRKLHQMVLKGVSWVHNDKIVVNGLEMSQLGTQSYIRSNAVERTKLGTQYKKKQIIWSWKELIGYPMIKFKSYGLERSHLGTQWWKLGQWFWKESIGYTMIKSG